MSDELDWSKIGARQDASIKAVLRGKGSTKGSTWLRSVFEDCPRKRHLDAGRLKVLQDNGQIVNFVEGARGIGILFHAYMELYHGRRLVFDPADVAFTGEDCLVQIDPVARAEADALARWWMASNSADMFGDVSCEVPVGPDKDGFTGYLDMVNGRIYDWKVVEAPKNKDTGLPEVNAAHYLMDPQNMLYRYLARQTFGRDLAFEYIFIGRPLARGFAPVVRREVLGPETYREDIIRNYLDAALARADEDYCDLSKCARKIYGKVVVCSHHMEGRCNRV